MGKWESQGRSVGCRASLGRIVSISISWAMTGGGFVVRVNDLRSKEGVRFATTKEAQEWALRLARQQLEAALADLAALEAAEGEGS